MSSFDSCLGDLANGRADACLNAPFPKYGHVICHDVGAPLGKCLKSLQSVIIVAHPLTLTLSPEAGERGFFQLPRPLGEGLLPAPSPSGHRR